jgi:hypothetical protein
MTTLSSMRSGRRSSAALAILMVAALGAAGCGGGGETSSQAQWASDVCSPVADWRSSITTIATDFSGGMSKDVITQKIDDAQQATTEMVDALNSVDPPQTEGGQQATDEISAFVDTVSSTVDSIKAEVASLPGSNRAAFTEALSTIASQVGTIVQEGKTTLSDIEQLDPQGELKTAIEDDPACQSLKEG